MRKNIHGFNFKNKCNITQTKPNRIALTVKLILCYFNWAVENVEHFQTGILLIVQVEMLHLHQKQ